MDYHTVRVHFLYYSNCSYLSLLYDNQQMHIYKYGQSYIIILHQYISVTLVTVVRMDALMMVRFPRAQH